MIRRFNYTGRKKITRSRVNISLSKDNEGRYFRAKLDLADLKFPSNAKIFIEPNYSGVYQRFEFGTVENFIHPENTYITELPETELVFFDVIVADEKNATGKILGKAKRIPASTVNSPNDRLPILYVNPIDLKDQIWRLNFDASDDGRPILEINNKIPELSEIAKNDWKFISLVYPIAFREVLTKIVKERDYTTGLDNWKDDWFKFLDILGVKSFPSDTDSDELSAIEEEWINDTVNQYCKHFQVFEKFTQND